MTFDPTNIKVHYIETHTQRGPTPPACEAALAWAAPFSLFQSSSSSPCALIRDPSSHSGTALRHFQLLPFPFGREFLNWQLEHDPNRRTDAIRWTKERVRGRQGQKHRREEEAARFYTLMFLWMTKDKWEKRTEWPSHPTARPRPRPCISVYVCACVSNYAVNYAMLHFCKSDTVVPLCKWLGETQAKRHWQSL